MVSLRRGFLEEDTVESLADPRKPQRRWRVHYQFRGHPITMRSFSIKVEAIKQADKIRQAGGRVMLEDRWNEL